MHPFQSRLTPRRVADSLVIGMLRGSTWLLILVTALIFGFLIRKGAPVLWDRGPGFVFGNSVPTTMIHFTDALGQERRLSDREKRIYDWLIGDPRFQRAFLDSEAAKNPRQLLRDYPDIARKLGGFTLLRTSLESGLEGAAAAADGLARALDPQADAELIRRLGESRARLAAAAELPLDDQAGLAGREAAPLASLVHSLDARLGAVRPEAEEALERARELGTAAESLRLEVLRASDRELEDPRFGQRSAELADELEPLIAAAAPAHPALTQAWADAKAAADTLQGLARDFPLARAHAQRADQVKAVVALLDQPKMREAVQAAISGEGEAEASSKSTPYSAGSLLGPIVGTVLLVLTCVVIALILGVAAAIYLSEYAHETPSQPKWGQVLLVTGIVSLLVLLAVKAFLSHAPFQTRAIAWAVSTLAAGLVMPWILYRWVHLVQLAIVNLAGVPSIVFGIFGFSLFVIAAPRITADPGSSEIYFRLWGDWVVARGWGTSVLAGAVTLAFMTLPVVIVASEEALKAVPKGFREASLALGGSQWQTIRKAVLPYATPGILTSSVLAITRVAGETAPIMFTAAVASRDLLPWQDGPNGINANPVSWLEQPVMALPYHVYTLSQKLPDTVAAEQAQYGSVLVFITLVFLLTLGSVLLRLKLRNKRRW